MVQESVCESKRRKKSSLSVTNEQERDEAGYQDVVYVWLACGWGPKAVVQWGSVEQFEWSL